MPISKASKELAAGAGGAGCATYWVDSVMLRQNSMQVCTS